MDDCIHAGTSVARLSNRIYVPVAGLDPGTLEQLRSIATAENPRYLRAVRSGRGRGDETPLIRGYRESGGWLALPRGLAARAVGLVRSGTGAPLPVDDRRDGVPRPAPPPGWRDGLREMQVEALEAVLGALEGDAALVGGGRLRIPTGVGKTRTALVLAAILGQKLLVVVPDTGLLRQWVAEAAEFLGVAEERVGAVGGGRFRPGDRVTVGVRDSLADGRRAAALARSGFGMLVLDEAQGGAARRCFDVVDRSAARYRFALSADERRRDAMEFMTAWLFGDVIYDGDRDDATQRGYIVPVTVRVVPTDFRAPWYGGGFGADWNRLLGEICADPSRNELVAELVSGLRRSGRDLPAVVFTHRRDYTAALAERLGVPCLRGGDADFEANKAALADGAADLAAATFQAFGVGQNVRRLRTGICATPLGREADKFFNQVRGRLVRLLRDKERGYLYYLWDRHVFGDMAQRLWFWNRGDVEMRDEAGRWRRADVGDLDAAGAAGPGAW